MMCGIGWSHSEPADWGWCTWHRLCPLSVGWRWQSWGGGWVPVADARSSSLTAALCWFYRSSSLINLDDSYWNAIDTPYSNYTTDGIPRQTYLAINTIQFNLLAILTPNQIPFRYTSNFPILPHYPQSVCRSLTKSNPTDEFAFARGRTNPDCLP